MPEYDASRQADISKLNAKIADPRTSAHERKRAEEALYVIRDQARSPSIQHMRERLYTATRNGDREAAERIAEEGRRMDRDYQ